MDVIFLGPPGAGKGTQAQLLSDGFGVRALSTGDMLRKHRADGTELGKKAQSFMDSGGLVPDDVIIGMMEQELASGGDVLLDGFPRTVAQAQALDALMQRQKRTAAVVLFDISLSLLEERLTGRWTNPRSGRVYHEKFNPPKVAGIDDVDGGPLIQRDDDKAETIRKRLEVYAAQTAPLVAYYGDRVKKIDATASMHDVALQLDEVIGLRNVA